MKRNTLTTAVLAGLTGMAGMVSVSNAVNVNPDGLGQVLLYPYYTARGGNDTLISIVNTTEQGKAVKIRFIEALNSREVLDFNIYMSPYDVWTAAITAEGDGGKMFTQDTTCTTPYFFDEEEGFGEQEFLTFEYTGSRTDAGPQGVERTASGYIEAIEMGSLLPQSQQSNDPSNPGYVPFAAKHVNGVPRDCAFLEELWRENPPPGPGPGDSGWWTPTEFGGAGETDWGLDLETGPSGGLFGAASIVNPLEGTMFSYNATAIDAFWAADRDAFHSSPGSVLPQLSSTGNTVSNVFDNGQVQTHDWAAGIFAVNAVLTFEELMNEYNIETVAGEEFGKSEWVLTFPTKRFHTDAAGAQALVPPDEPIAPFTETWSINSDGTPNLACEAMSFRVWDREEQEPTPDTGGVPVSPRPPGDQPEVFELCREANVVRFSTEEAIPDQTEILKEVRREGPFARLSFSNFQLPGFESGWVKFDLAEVPNIAGVSGAGTTRNSTTGLNTANGAPETVDGLPVVGFWVNTFTGSPDGSFLANYGGTFNHRGSRQFSPAED